MSCHGENCFPVTSGCWTCPFHRRGANSESFGQEDLQRCRSEAFWGQCSQTACSIALLFSFKVCCCLKAYSAFVSYPLPPPAPCLQAFVIFCGLGINNTMMYNQVKKTWAKQSVALDVRTADYWLFRTCFPFFNNQSDIQIRYLKYIYSIFQHIFGNDRGHWNSQNVTCYLKMQ